jgi:hypothetical protein
MAQPQTRFIGSRDYPCGHGHTTTRGLDKPGAYSRRCQTCGAHWVLRVVEPIMKDRFGHFLKLTWDKS